MLAFLHKLFGSAAADGGPSELHPSAKCPECGSRLMRPGPETAWRCPNPDCPPHVRERLLHWCSPAAMDIPGCDAGVVAQLVAKGLAYDPAELYRLRLPEAAALAGFDETKARTLFDAIAASRTREACRVLFGLAIPGVGAAEAQALCAHYKSLDALFAAGRERIQREAGAPEAVARSIAHWYGDPVNRKLIKRLEKAGVNFKASTGTSSKPPS